jgi:hypothetical protein
MTAVPDACAALAGTTIPRATTTVVSTPLIDRDILVDMRIMCIPPSVLIRVGMPI